MTATTNADAVCVARLLDSALTTLCDLPEGEPAVDAEHLWPELHTHLVVKAVSGHAGAMGLRQFWHEDDLTAAIDEAYNRAAVHAAGAHRADRLVDQLAYCFVRAGRSVDAGLAESTTPGAAAASGTPCPRCGDEVHTGRHPNTAVAMSAHLERVHQLRGTALMAAVLQAARP